jgi:hypothetical protein
MSYRVLTCLLATGQLCHPDGRLYLITDGLRDDPVFPTQADAERYCHDTVARHPDLECWVMGAAGVVLFRVPPVFDNDTA